MGPLGQEGSDLSLGYRVVFAAKTAKPSLQLYPVLSQFCIDHLWTFE